MSIMGLGQNLQFIFYAFISGFFPALLWLWFWLREDAHPEPKKMIFKTFLAGAAVIPAVALIQYILLEIFSKFNLTGLNLTNAANYSFPIILTLAAVEEYFKYFAAKQTALNKKDFDEPVDALIYLITAALGFSAVENAIYIFQGFGIKGLTPTIVSGNFRFLGASLIHIISSAAIGAGIAFSFFHPARGKKLKTDYLIPMAAKKDNNENKGLLNNAEKTDKKHLKRNIIFGFLTAVLLHSFFNYFIINSGENIFSVFLGVWILAIIIIYIFERIKK